MTKGIVSIPDILQALVLTGEMSYRGYVHSLPGTSSGNEMKPWENSDCSLLSSPLPLSLGSGGGSEGRRIMNVWLPYPYTYLRKTVGLDDSAPVLLDIAPFWVICELCPHLVNFDL